MKAYFFSLLVLSLCLGCSDERVESAGQNADRSGSDGKNDTLVGGEGMAGSMEVDEESEDDGEAMPEDGEDTSGEEDILDPDNMVDPSEDEDSMDMDAEDEPDVEEAPDPFAEALDVNLHRVEFPEGTVAPDYTYPRAESFRLGGTEFWQKWTGGQNPTYSYYDGSEPGKRCMYASARRFEAIMADPPEALLALKENSNWGGSFFNWNDDFTGSDYGDGRSARLWAWRTSLVKWISQTNQDGSCYLPTREMVENLAESCGGRAASRDGEIQGCSAY